MSRKPKKTKITVPIKNLIKVFVIDKQMDQDLYEITITRYKQMNHLLHYEDVEPYRKQIQSFQQLYLIYVMVYTEPIFGEFLILLQELMDKMN